MRMAVAALRPALSEGVDAHAHKDNPIIEGDEDEETNSVSTECFLDPSKCEGREEIILADPESEDEEEEPETDP